MNAATDFPDDFKCPEWCTRDHTLMEIAAGEVFHEHEIELPEPVDGLDVWIQAEGTESAIAVLIGTGGDSISLSPLTAAYLARALQEASAWRK